jgi:hypothetical protein
MNIPDNPKRRDTGRNPAGVFFVALDVLAIHLAK